MRTAERRVTAPCDRAGSFQGLACSLLALAGVLVAAPHRAEACTLFEDVPSEGYPQDGAVDVPTDTRIWVRFTSDPSIVDRAEVVLEGPDGAIPVSFAEVLSDGPYVVAAWTPTVTLAPRAAHTLRVQVETELLELGFRTGGGVYVPPANARSVAGERLTSTFRDCDGNQVTCVGGVGLVGVIARVLDASGTEVAQGVRFDDGIALMSEELGTGTVEVTPLAPTGARGAVTTLPLTSLTAYSTDELVWEDGVRCFAGTLFFGSRAASSLQSGSSSGGCAVGRPSAGGAAWLAVLGALWLVRRRNRR